MEKDLTVQNIDIENKMVSWVWQMSNKAFFIAEAEIAEKARRVENYRNLFLPPHQKTEVF